MIVRHATEAELEKEAKRLWEMVKARKATLAEANHLAEIEAALKRIAAVRSGKAWA